MKKGSEKDNKQQHHLLSYFEVMVYILSLLYPTTVTPEYHHYGGWGFSGEYMGLFMHILSLERLWAGRRAEN